MVPLWLHILLIPTNCMVNCIFWPAATWAEGTMLKIYEWTAAGIWGIFTGSGYLSVTGNMNEYQLLIGETTSAKTEFNDRTELWTTVL